MYKITGIDRFFSKEIYWEGDSLKECLKYFEILKRCTALSTVKFKWVECECITTENINANMKGDTQYCSAYVGGYCCINNNNSEKKLCDLCNNSIVCNEE